MNAAKSLTLYLFKGYSSAPSKDAPPQEPGKKVYVSTSKKPLSEESIQNAIKLRGVVEFLGPFTQVVAAPATPFQTAIIALGGTKEEALAGKSDKVTVENDWRQVEMGKLAIEAEKIQEAYAKAFPNALWIPEPNDCMNHEWPNHEEYGFEPYIDKMEPRIRGVLDKMLSAAKSEHDQALVFTAKEPMRTVMLIAEPSNQFKMSDFYSKIVCYKKNEINGSLQNNKVERFTLNPKDGSWIKIRLEGKKVILEEVSDDVEFRTKAPVAGYRRK